MYCELWCCHLLPRCCCIDVIFQRTCAACQKCFCVFNYYLYIFCMFKCHASSKWCECNHPNCYVKRCTVEGITVYSPALLIYSSLYLFPLDGREKGDYGTMINGHFMKCPIYIYERNAKYRQERNSMCLNILVLKSNQVFIWAVPYLSPKWSAAASAAPC